MIKQRLLTALLMGGIIATGAYAQAEKGDSDDMTKKTHELNPVVVTGTGTHTRLKNTPSPVSVITANEIKRAGITDFQQALTGRAGIEWGGGVIDYAVACDLSDDERTLQQARADIGKRTQGHGRHHR